MQTLHSKIPVQRVPMIGRETELAQARGLLQQEEVSLLTLTGPGGVGKTRLALQIASDLLNDFENESFFVPLAPVTDPSHVPAAIAQALGIHDAPGHSITDALKEHLRDRRLILLLDNFEHVVDAAPLVSDLLSSAPQVKALVTSREVLRIYGEHEFPIAPLELPPGDRALSVEQLMEWPAVRLFVERAVAARPDFALDAANARAVAEICRRLDGLPLAIELAAARVRIMSPQMMLARLMGAKADAGRMPLLTGGARDLPHRQQTLGNTIEWSYNLLDGDEQRLFRLLSLFVGGCTFEAAGAILDFGPFSSPFAPLRAKGSFEGKLWITESDREGSEIRNPKSKIQNIEDAIESLVNKSLLKQDEVHGGEPRFTMLETIREYARQKLEESGEDGEAWGRYAAYFLALAEEAEPQLIGPRQLEWLDRLEREHDNLRAVLLQAENKGNVELGLRLVGALYQFWNRRGHLIEGRERILAMASRAEALELAPTPAHARVLTQAAALAHRQSDLAAARSLAQQALAMSQGLAYKLGMARALVILGSVNRVEGNLSEARTLFEQTLQLNRELQDKWNIANTLNNLGLTASNAGDSPSALSYFGESLSMFREIGDSSCAADTLRYMAYRAYWTGAYDSVRSYGQESLGIYRELGDRVGMASSLNLLGAAALWSDDYDTADSRFVESLALARDVDDKWLIPGNLEFLGYSARYRGDYRRAHELFSEAVSAWRGFGKQKMAVQCIVGVAGVIAASGNPSKAAKLFGFAEPVFETEGYPAGPEAQQYDSDVAFARSQLGQAAFVEAEEQGQRLSIEEATALALEPLTDLAHLAPSLQQVPESLVVEPYLGDLTGREVEVLCLVAVGKSNVQIAEELSLSINTVQAHLRSTFNKIGVASRSQAAHYAYEHHLV